MIKQQLEADLKQALLAGDKVLVSTLRNLKNAILYAEVEQGRQQVGLDDASAMKVLAKEAKKLQESADIYEGRGEQARAQAELKEKAIIESYLPKQLSENELAKLVDGAIAKIGSVSQSNMGQVIGAVRAEAGPTADGATIARLVKEKLQA